MNRNVVNQDSLKNFLSEVINYDNPWIKDFLSGRMFKFLLKSSPIKEVSGEHPFPGPYHEVILSLELKQGVQRVVDELFVKISKKMFLSPLEISSWDFESLIFNGLTYVKYDGKHNIFLINSTEKLNELGLELHNCLRYRTKYSNLNSSYYAFYDDSFKLIALGEISNGSIKEIRLDKDKKASVEFFNALKSLENPSFKKEESERSLESNDIKVSMALSMSASLVVVLNLLMGGLVTDPVYLLAINLNLLISALYGFSVLRPKMLESKKMMYLCVVFLCGSSIYYNYKVSDNLEHIKQFNQERGIPSAYEIFDKAESKDVSIISVALRGEPEVAAGFLHRSGFLKGDKVFFKSLRKGQWIYVFLCLMGAVIFAGISFSLIFLGRIQFSVIILILSIMACLPYNTPQGFYEIKKDGAVIFHSYKENLKISK